MARHTTDDFHFIRPNRTGYFITSLEHLEQPPFATFEQALKFANKHKIIITRER